MIANALSPAKIVLAGDITVSREVAVPIIQESMFELLAIHAPGFRPAKDGTTGRLRSAVALVMEDKHR